jgi:FkbM family methyltransferase
VGGGGVQSGRNEPSPDNFALLRCDGRIVPIHAEVTAMEGPIKLDVSPIRRPPSAVSQNGAGAYREHLRDTVAVPGRSLDSLLVENDIDLADVGAVRVDTQGHEAHVLRSAPRIMAARIPMVIEYRPYGLVRADGQQMLHELIAAILKGDRCPHRRRTCKC